MTADEMIAYAKAVAEGGPVKKSDVVAFMKALLHEAAPVAASAPTATPGAAPASTAPVTGVSITSTGKLHLGPDVVRVYTRAEARSLVAHLDALSSTLA